MSEPTPHQFNLDAWGNAMRWTDERVERLRALWADGLSASQIAAELGGMTRNAVIGKVHRLGLPARRDASQRKPSARVPRERKATAQPFKLDVERFMRDITGPIVSAHPVKLIDLKEHHCRWVIGEPTDMLFCGNQKVETLSYCLGHCRMVYEAPRVRRNFYYVRRAA